MTIRIRKGTYITCERKGHWVGTFNRDIDDRTPVVLDRVIDFAPGQEKQAGDEMICSVCGSRYVVDDNWHTPDGWVPNQPYTEPVTRRK